MRTVRLRIEGRVQGVGFRAFVEREAGARSIVGFVRNRRDGGVEVVAHGADDAIDAFISVCQKGPYGARPDFIKILDEPASVAVGFTIAPTV